MNFYEYPIAVPFGNPNYDVQLGGSHNMTFACPPNTPIISVTDNTIITDISAPKWGKQVTVKLNTPINGHDYFSYQHLSAVNPFLAIGSVLHYGDSVGWSGGCTSEGQYDGTHNPTGQNFIDTPDMSSQPQAGIALCDGTGYGYRGWVTFPPIEQSLNPYPVIEAYIKATTPPPPDYKREQFNTMWQSVMHGANPNTGIANAAYQEYINGNDHGYPQTMEMENVDWSGEKHIVQLLSTGMYYWYPDGRCIWHPFKG